MTLVCQLTHLRRRAGARWPVALPSRLSHGGVRRAKTWCYAHKDEHPAGTMDGLYLVGRLGRLILGRM